MHPRRSGWAPDPLMVGIRSPDGLVVGLAPATLEFSFPKREEPGKTGRHPVLKYRVPHGSHPSLAPLLLSLLLSHNLPLPRVH